MKEDIDRYYPKLVAAGYERTSDETTVYNCIAWAAGDTSRWWECDEDGPLDRPGVYWPPDAKHGFGLDALVSAYETLGFKVCETSGPEEGYEKVALFRDGNEWRHAAKLLNDGKWSSKLGDLEDISHFLPEDVEGDYNGILDCYMRRPIPS